ncbi:MAG TPA: P-loop NTPase fold protein, partial [Polyangiales bacterium]|nr:P-loop NTPase fold protein [Polyangiales bacterium]
MLATKGLDATGIAELKAAQPVPIALSDDKQLLSSSARQVLINADAWAQHVHGSDIGVRHLIAAYVLNPPPNHRQQLKDWGYDELLWRSHFYLWVELHATWEQWKEAQAKAPPTQGFASYDGQRVKGATLAWPGDHDALRVLDRAAEIHAMRKDRWLRLNTIFHALIDLALREPSLREQIDPLARSVEQAGQVYLAARRSYTSSEPAAAIEPFADLDVSPRVLNLLESARELQSALDPSSAATISVLHLAGALLSRRVDYDDRLLELGIQPEPIRQNMLAFVQRRGASMDVWNDMLGLDQGESNGDPIALNSDEPEAVIRLDEEWKTDPLGIRPDVNSFAALLASKRLQPPLSIGLFGPWGSGKSTFLRRLRRAVDMHVKPAAPPDPSSPYLTGVVHVDFNAWHYAEQALVSSIIDTIFRAVRAAIKD